MASINKQIEEVRWRGERPWWWDFAVIWGAREKWELLEKFILVDDALLAIAIDVDALTEEADNGRSDEDVE